MAKKSEASGSGNGAPAPAAPAEGVRAVARALAAGYGGVDESAPLDEGFAAGSLADLLNPRRNRYGTGTRTALSY